jgi:hypothetical protein
MQAIFDRENRLGMIESVGTKILKNDLVKQNCNLFFVKVDFFFSGRDELFGCAAA